MKNSVWHERNPAFLYFQYLACTTISNSIKENFQMSKTQDYIDQYLVLMQGEVLGQIY